METLFETLDHIFNPNIKQQTMSCTECRGYGGTCPCCEEDPKMITCEECSGTGRIYYVGEEEVPKDIYDKVKVLVPKACDYMPCTDCMGEGEVKEEPYEPDPDEEYERKREEE